MQEKLGPRLEQARRGRRQVYFVDAAHFVFAPFLGCLWCAARLFVRAASGRKRYNVLGALDAVTHRLVRVTNHDYINAESVCALLRAVAAAVGLPITLVLDNARYQKCAVVQAVAASLGIELLYLPSYSPNLNLIERLWRFVRKESLDSIYYEDLRFHGRDRSVPGRSAHGTQGRDGNSNDSQVPDVWRCATIGRVEYKQVAADGVLRTSHGQDVVPQPAGQQRHLVSPRDRFGLSQPRRPQLLDQRLILPATPPNGGGLLSLELGPGVDGFVGPVLQVTNQRPNVVQRMKNITAAGTPRQSLLVPAGAPRRNGAGGLGSEPGRPVPAAGCPKYRRRDALPDSARSRRSRRHRPHQDGIARLEDLIDEADEDAGEVVLRVDSGPDRRGVHDVVHGPQGDLMIEEVAQQVDHAAGRTWQINTKPRTSCRSQALVIGR